MSLRINDEAPDFSAETTQAPVHIHERYPRYVSQPN